MVCPFLIKTMKEKLRMCKKNRKNTTKIVIVIMLQGMAQNKRERQFIRMYVQKKTK